MGDIEFYRNALEVCKKASSYKDEIIKELKDRCHSLSDRVNCQKNRIACLEYDLKRCKYLLQQWQEIHKHMAKCHRYINHSEFHSTFGETEKIIQELENE